MNTSIVVLLQRAEKLAEKGEFKVLQLTLDEIERRLVGNALPDILVDRWNAICDLTPDRTRPRPKAYDITKEL